MLSPKHEKEKRVENLDVFQHKFINSKCEKTKILQIYDEF